MDIDSAGKRIKTYKRICFIVNQLNSIRKCATGYVAKEDKVYFVPHTPQELQTSKVTDALSISLRVVEVGGIDEAPNQVEALNWVTPVLLSSSNL
jgi:hypothetical protein